MPQTTPYVARALIAMPFALALAQPAAAVEDSDFKFDTTSDLIAICSTPADAAEYLVANEACRAFIEATVQYHDEVSDRKHLKRLICYPATTTIEDGKAALAAWATTHSGDQKLMGEQPVVGLMRALAAKYPCKK